MSLKMSAAVTRTALLMCLATVTAQNTPADTCGQVTLTLSRDHMDSLCYDQAATHIPPAEESRPTLAEFQDLLRNFGLMQTEMRHLRGQMISLRHQRADLDRRMRSLEEDTASWRQIVAWPGRRNIRFRPDNMSLASDEATRYRDCYDAYHRSGETQGIFALHPDGMSDILQPFFAHCDVGGWTVFLRRFNNTVDFYRGWDEYSAGFGRLFSEFWLGLEYLHYLTQQDDYELRVEALSWSGRLYHATHTHFRVGNEMSGYRLSVGAMTAGNSADVMTPLNDLGFTTRDVDNDKWLSNNCATYYHGAWWLRKCGFDPNRRWCHATSCMSWGDRPVQKIVMKIRPVSATDDPPSVTPSTTTTTTAKHVPSTPTRTDPRTSHTTQHRSTFPETTPTLPTTPPTTMTTTEDVVSDSTTIESTNVEPITTDVTAPETTPSKSMDSTTVPMTTTEQTTPKTTHRTRRPRPSKRTRKPKRTRRPRRLRRRRTTTPLHTVPAAVTMVTGPLTTSP